MRFLIIVKTSPEPVPDPEIEGFPGPVLIHQMATFHEALAKAGVLLDGACLKPLSQGGCIRYDGHLRQVLEGPDAEPKELIAGYMLIQARTRDEALEWGKRFPGPDGQVSRAEIEVRPIQGLDTGLEYGIGDSFPYSE